MATLKLANGNTIYTRGPRWYECGKPMEAQLPRHYPQDSSWLCRRYVGHDGPCALERDDSTHSTNANLSERS